MYSFLAAAAAIALTLACASTKSNEGANVTQTCDYVTFARFEGIRYVPSMTNDGLDGVTLGPEYAKVARRLSRDTGSCQDYTISDGDATDVSPGVPFYEVHGYPPQLLLATELGLWEADYAPAARFGRDVLDIGRKVTRIAVLIEPVSALELGAIDDPTTIGVFFDDVLGAPVVADTDQRGTFQQYWLRFEMDDGLVVVRRYRPDSGELWNGIMLPNSARTIIAEAVGR